jgi:Domain of unknown function (DUF5666)
MHSGRRITGALAAVGFGCIAIAGLSARAAPNLRTAYPPEQAAAPNASSRPIGTIQSIVGNLLVLKTDAGAQVSVMAGDSTKILRIEPGQKDLSQAAVIHAQDLQVGDRILVSGQMSGDGKSVNATTIIVMKKSDLDAKQQQEREAWQHGVGGLVKSADAPSGTIVVNVSALGGTKTVTIHTTKDTILRRYAPDSVKFDEAKPAAFAQIHPGDQLRARGTASADGTEFTAEEIVSGSFRNIAGTIVAIDAAANTIRVKDLIAKKEVVVKFTPESEIRQLPPMMARGIAMRLRGGQGGGVENGRGAAQGNRPADAQGAGQPGRFPRMRNGAGGAPGDLQQMLSRLPAVQVADLQKDEAVMIVSTEGAVPGEVTAITMLGGVEPILEAAPKGQQAMTLSPWSLSAPSEGDSN